MTDEEFVSWLDSNGFPIEPELAFAIKERLMRDSGEMKATGYAMVTPHVMTFEIPDNFNPSGQFVEALEAKKKEIQAEFQKRITDIQEEINKLTAISYEVTA